MDSQLIPLYELVLILKQELVVSQLELRERINTHGADHKSILKLALLQQRLTVLLEILVRELLMGEPEMLAFFDEKVFDIGLKCLLKRYAISHSGSII